MTKPHFSGLRKYFPFASSHNEKKEKEPFIARLKKIFFYGGGMSPIFLRARAFENFQMYVLSFFEAQVSNSDTHVFKIPNRLKAQRQS